MVTEPLERRHTTPRPNYRRYWLSLYRRDVGAASALVDQALRCWPPQRVYLKLFEPALNLSGLLWARGRITYHDEHFVTHHTLRFMRRVRRRFVPPDAFGPLAVATGVAQDSHLIGLRLVCDFLAWSNWRVHWLSSNDRATAGEAVTRLKPNAVLISIGRDTGLTPAARLIADFRRRGYAGLIAVGGQAVRGDEAVAGRLGADLTATDAAALVRLLRARFPSMGRRGAVDRLG